MKGRRGYLAGQLEIMFRVNRAESKISGVENSVKKSEEIVIYI